MSKDPLEELHKISGVNALSVQFADFCVFLQNNLLAVQQFSLKVLHIFVL